MSAFDWTVTDHAEVPVGRGVWPMPPEIYHADPCEQPSLSSSIAHLICSASPAHAWAAHPRLNPAYKRDDSEKYDIGTAAHAMLLQGDNIVQPIDAADWRTKDAREQRDRARATGKVPLLAHVLDDVKQMVKAARTQLYAHRAEPELFSDGKPERTLVWEEPGGVTCRARLDWLHDDKSAIDDLKTTSRSANPEAYSRALFGVGGDVQAAMYIRGMQELTGETPDFRWCVIETQPPYALSVISPGPDVLSIGASKVRYAIETWRRCLATGDWPGYPRETCFATLPPYEEARWLEKELREAA